MKRNNMYDSIYESYKKYKDKNVFTYLNSEISYNTLINKIDECALSFKKIGVNKNEIVSLIINNSIESIISIYALNKIGAVCNLINPNSSNKQIENIINKTNTKYIVISDMYLNKINDNYTIITLPDSERLSLKDRIKFILKNNNNYKNIIPFYRFILKGKKLDNKIKSECNKDDSSLIISNNSKSIILSNNNLNSYAINSKIDTKNYNKIFTSYNITDSYGISLIHKSLINGYNLILSNNINDIVKYKPSIIECNPNLLNNLLLNRKIIKNDLSFIKYIICGQDYLSEALKDKMNKILNANIITNYGLRECTANVTINRKPINSLNIKIFKENTFDECDINEIGEICISGPSVMSGYFDENNDSLKKYKGKVWLRSNDLGYKDEFGNIVFKSSKKRIIISDGNNIYPSEIENIIVSHKYVKACSVVGVPHPYKKEVVKAYIVLKDNLILNSEIKKSIKEYAENNIPKYALPYAYGYRKELPKNINGKVAYQELINTKEEN